MRWRRRLGRLVLACGAVLLVAMAVVLWGLFWPGDVPSITCGAHPPVNRCIQISGRVVLSGRSFDPDHQIHAVLLSRSSVTLPGITSVELPPLATAPAGLGFGDWVSVIGFKTTGAHGEQDVHAFGLETADVTVRCASDGGNCTERRRR